MIHVTFPPSYRTETKEPAVTELPPQVQHWEQTPDPMTYAEAFDRVQQLMLAQDFAQKGFKFGTNAWYHVYTNTDSPPRRSFEWEIYLVRFEKHFTAKTLEQIVSDVERFLAPAPLIADQLAVANVTPVMEATR